MASSGSPSPSTPYPTINPSTKASTNKISMTRIRNRIGNFRTPKSFLGFSLLDCLSVLVCLSLFFLCFFCVSVFIILSFFLFLFFLFPFLFFFHYFFYGFLVFLS